MATNSIRYIYNSNMGMELIFCENSTISYPTHNHVSVLTIGIVLDGSIVLTANNNEKVYEKNQTFIICPYMPHSISAHSSYTLLSLCIDKNIAAHYSTDKIRHNIMALLMNALNSEKSSWNYTPKPKLVLKKWLKTHFSVNTISSEVLRQKWGLHRISFNFKTASARHSD